MIVHNPSGASAEEIRKHEQHNTVYAMTPDGDFAPGNPYVFRPYPKMLYMARTHPRSGKPSVGDVMPHPLNYKPGDLLSLERDTNFVESFNRSCQKIVKNEDEHLIAKGQGWCELQTDALEQAERRYEAIAEEAAREHFRVSKMSPEAQTEFQKADRMTSDHVLDVKPKRKRGRPSKGVEPVTADGE